MSEIATLQRIAGDNFFKVRAFETASRFISDLHSPVDALIDDRSIFSMKGIGESIEAELQSLRMYGHSPRHQELLRRIGPGVLDLIQVNGLGMKRLQILFNEVGIRDVATLKKACLDGSLIGVQQFGERVVDKLIGEIEHWERTKGKRYPLPEAKGLAESIQLQLATLDCVERSEVGGSIRRGRETIGDIDILITTDDVQQASDYFKNMPEAVEVIFDGNTRASIRVVGGIQVDLRALDVNAFGAGMHYFTGSKLHHIRMRIRSKKMGLKISEKGVVPYDDPDSGPIGPMDTETEIFNAVGLPYIPPEIRMGKEEIDLAEKDMLPDLLSLEMLSGDMHLHTCVSGGRSTLDEIAHKASKLGYQWIVVAERSLGVDVKGLNNEEMRKHILRVRDIDTLHGVKLIPGAEVAIDANGMFDIDHRILSDCEFVLGVIRGDENMEAEEMTQRILWGVETGLLSCLGSPTGRHLGVDNGFDFYFDDVVRTCVDFGVALEMNAHPNRIDLNQKLAARVKELGGMIMIGSDSGSALGMESISYGIQQAKRAWFEEADVLNSKPADEMLGSLRRLR